MFEHAAGDPVRTDLWRICADRVLAPDGLLVSNFSEEVKVPYAEISDVYEDKWINIRPTTLVLKHPCRFGTKIVFMPYTRFTLAFWRDHPAAAFLRARIGT